MGLTERNQVRLRKRYQMQAYKSKLCEVFGIGWTVMINSNLSHALVKA